jgi:hypothetical protein
MAAHDTTATTAIAYTTATTTNNNTTGAISISLASKRPAENNIVHSSYLEC